MEVIHGLEAFPKQRVPVILALGTFDGVHLGHQALIGTAVRRAMETYGRCAVFTFDPHPRTVLAPSDDPFLLTTLDERLELIALLGADLTVVVRFDEAFARTPGEAWVAALVSTTAMAEVVCGATYVFGHNRGGNVGLLMRLGAQLGFRVRVTDPVHVDDVPISSTRIRHALRGGDVTEAARLLGRYYALQGRVVRGDGRGRALGYPTANLAIPPGKFIPRPGIYAGYAQVGAREFQTAISIGVRPTFGPGPLVVEAYLLEFAGSLYDTALTVRVAARLHDEQAFSSVPELVRQIGTDVASVPQALADAARRTGFESRNTGRLASTPSSSGVAAKPTAGNWPRDP